MKAVTVALNLAFNFCPKLSRASVWTWVVEFDEDSSRCFRGYALYLGNMGLGWKCCNIQLVGKRTQIAFFIRFSFKLNRVSRNINWFWLEMYIYCSLGLNILCSWHCWVLITCNIRMNTQNLRGYTLRSSDTGILALMSVEVGTVWPDLHIVEANITTLWAPRYS